MHALVFAEPGLALTVVAGVPALERLLRTLARCGVRTAVVASSDTPALQAGLLPSRRFRESLEVVTCRRPARSPLVEDALACWMDGQTRMLVFPALGVFDQRLLKALVRKSGVCALAQRGSARGPAVLDREWLAARSGGLAAAVALATTQGSLPSVDVEAVPTYIPSMRRDLRPFCVTAFSEDSDRQEAEDVIVEAAQKKALDFPAYVHAPIENALVRLLWSTRLTPNQMSLIGNVVAWAGTALFVFGYLGLGLILALVVGVLDGVDGKLARVKVETTPSGKLEHWFDGVFEISWAAGLAFHFWSTGLRPDAWWLLALLLGAEAVDGAAKGAIILRYGKQIDDIAPLDRAIRLLGGRRNVYVWIMTGGLLLGAAPAAFALVAYWEAATAVVHVARAAWLLRPGAAPAQVKP